MSKFCMGCMEQYDDEYEICPHCGYIEGTKPEKPLHMEPGSILQGRYIVGKSIGFGGFGVTYIGWDALLEQKVAIKEYLPSEFSTRMPGVTQVTIYNGDKSEQFRDGLDKFIEEAKKLAKFQNVEGIVKVFDSFGENNTAYIVMEYLEGETLAQFLAREKKMNPDEAIAMLLPVMESLQVVHEQGIVHRDIAPDNLFITKEHGVKLIDFGAARFVTTSHSRSLTVLIKQGYSPEEQYRSDANQGGYTDVYALAATLYRMITGVVPPDAMVRYGYAESKNKEVLEPISKYCKDIDVNQENAILNAMNVRIEDRTPSMAAFIKDLKSDHVVRVWGKIRKIDTLQWPLWMKIVVPTVASLLLLVSVLFATGVIGFENTLQTGIKIPEGMTRVPSVVNNTVEQAEDRLEQAVLLYTITGKAYSSLVPADYVLSQDVSGGILLTQNSIVSVSISGGVEQVTVPDVLNMNIEEAIKLLEDSGFVVSKIEEYSNTIEEGSVISQSEQANTSIDKGAVITIVVSKGVDPESEIEEKEIEVPELIGKTYEEVLAIAEELGFMLSIAERKYSSEYAVNEVMEQTPANGTTIKTGETVTIVVSLGKELVKVADVQYKTEAEAKALLEGLKLKVKVSYVESETVAQGLVITQNIAADTTVEPGTEIELIVSKGAASFDMPNVVGMKEAEAKNSLTGKGLSVTVTYEYSSSATGTVLKQSINANTKVKRGTAVTITVSSGEEMITIPSVTGQDSSTAQTTLKNSGFAVTINSIYSDTVAEGTVISQAPQSGTSQKKGSTVVLTVSLGKDTVKSMSIATKPSKTTYFVGETFNPAGMTLKLTYKSGTVQTISSGYTCNPTELNKAGKQTITVSYLGMSATVEVTVTDAVLSSIVVKTKPSKMSYFIGDPLDKSGLTLTATYNNGKTETISSGYTCSPTTLNTAGNQTITVTYGGKTTSFTVSVTSVSLSSIAIKSNPSKMTYYKGDTLSTAGLSLTATYNSGKTETINTGFTCNPTTLNTVGNQKITVSYGGKTAIFNVTVEEVELSSISVKNNPSKVSYYVGDTLDTTGFTLTAVYNNGTSKTISSGYTCSPTTLNTAGTQKITVTYGGQTATFNVTVIKESISSIEVKTNPSKTTYYVGDTLNTNGLVLTVHYDNGKTETVSSGYSCDTTTLSTAGTQKITVTYGGKTATFNVSVAEVEISSVAVKTLPSKTTYYVGDTLDQSGLTLMLTYNNGKTETVSSGYSCSPTTLSTAGSQKISVSYKGKSTSFNVTVEEVELSSISVKSNPSKVSYYVGDTLDISGLTLTAVYNNGTSKTINSGYTCSPTTLNTAGTQKITVTYGGKTATFNVTIIKESISSIAVKTLPSKTSYYVGDTLDMRGLTLTATYNNGKTETISSGFTCSPTTLTAGTQKITVTYGGKTTTFNVTVTEIAISSIAVKTNPSKTTYYVGDTLDISGLTLTAVYNNGTSKIISSGYTCSPTTLSTAGTQKITVTYGGKTTTFNLTVIEVLLNSISIASMPSKTSYYVGDTLDISGLKVTALYNNGKTENVSGYSVEPAIMKNVGTQVITVKYKGKSTTYNVVVKNGEVENIVVKTKPYKTTYYAGDMLDADGLKLTVTYNNGRTEVISAGYVCTPQILNTPGYQTITVTYGEKSTTFDVNVNHVYVKSIAVKTMPTKTIYYQGDTLDLSGLTLTVTYNNGTIKTVSSGYSCNTTTLDYGGTSTITVTYEGKSTTFSVNVIGICGDNLTWTRSGQKLIISGSGKMYDYDITDNSPFDNSYIEEINFPEGLTHIGIMAFKYCGGLINVTIPSSVKSIGQGAFIACENLTNVKLQNGITYIGPQAFACTNLINVTVPSSVTKIDYLAFECENLQDIYILNPTCEIEYHSTANFEYCRTLGNVNLTTIHGFANSTAQEFAEYYGYKFVVIE